MGVCSKDSGENQRDEERSLQSDARKPTRAYHEIVSRAARARIEAAFRSWERSALLPGRQMWLAPLAPLPLVSQKFAPRIPEAGMSLAGLDSHFGSSAIVGTVAKLVACRAPQPRHRQERNANRMAEKSHVRLYGSTVTGSAISVTCNCRSHRMSQHPQTWSTHEGRLHTQYAMNRPRHMWLQRATRCRCSLG